MQRDTPLWLVSRRAIPHGSVAFSLLAVFAALAQPLPAHALWCSSDPVVSLNRTVVDITVSIPLAYILYVNGPVRYTIQTPSSVVRKLVVNDVGYNGHGVTVSFTNRVGGINGNQFLTTVKVYVPIDMTKLPVGTRVPTLLTVFPLNGKQLQVSGTSQSTAMSLWITST
jgi:hypothetical protein